MNRPDSEAHQQSTTDPGEMLDQYQARIHKYLRYRGLDVEEANDLTSAVFERAFRKLASYDPARGALNTWLFAIARNILNSHWRAARSHRALRLEAVDEQPAFDPPPEEVVVRRETRQELIEALDKTLGCPMVTQRIAPRGKAPISNSYLEVIRLASWAARQHSAH